MDLKHILQGLKSEIGEVPKITIEDFENWGKTQKPGKVLTTTPTSTEQVQRVIKAARKKNLKVQY